jgi:hypothetical protein
MFSPSPANDIGGSGNTFSALWIARPNQISPSGYPIEAQVELSQQVLGLGQQLQGYTAIIHAPDPSSQRHSQSRIGCP